MTQIRPLSRLCGLETEMAIRTGSRNKSNCIDAYDKIIQRIKASTSWATSKRHDIKRGIFLANGGAVEFERLLPGASTGLLETCSAECESPAQLIASQRATERSLIRATEEITDESITLLKNCGDPQGSVYGAQENYEIQSHDPDELARHQRTVRVHTFVDSINGSLFGILPLILLLGFVSVPILTAGLVTLTYAISCLTRGRFASVTTWFFDVLATIMCPIYAVSSWFYRQTKMGRTYEALTPFLVSRVVFAGSGTLNRRGKFLLGQKAASRNTDYFCVHTGFQNSILCVNEAVLLPMRQRAEPHLYSGNPLLRKRLRMSLSIGDSNMCQYAEYLKVATTSLVIDAIEAGFITEPPLMPKVIRSLRKFNSDPQMKVSVDTARGSMTALEIQQFYLNACRRYVEQHPDENEEACHVLKMWSQTLTQLATQPKSLVGKIDWITKRYLMRELAKSSETTNDFGSSDEFKGFADRDSLRKIDFKYHELSDDGYYFQLQRATLTQPVIDEESVRQAWRLPPSSSSATTRSRYIREFSDEIEWVTWEMLKLSTSDKIVRLQKIT